MDRTSVIGEPGADTLSEVLASMTVTTSLMKRDPLTSSTNESCRLCEKHKLLYDQWALLDCLCILHHDMVYVNLQWVLTRVEHAVCSVASVPMSAVYLHVAESLSTICLRPIWTIPLETDFTAGRLDILQLFPSILASPLHMQQIRSTQSC